MFIVPKSICLSSAQQVKPLNHHYVYIKQKDLAITNHPVLTISCLAVCRFLEYQITWSMRAFIYISVFCIFLVLLSSKPLFGSKYIVFLVFEYLL